MGLIREIKKIGVLVELAQQGVITLEGEFVLDVIDRTSKGNMTISSEELRIQILARRYYFDEDRAYNRTVLERLINDHNFREWGIEQYRDKICPAISN